MLPLFHSLKDCLEHRSVEGHWVWFGEETADEKSFARARGQSVIMKSFDPYLTGHRIVQVL